MNIKSFFSFLFKEEIKELESCKEEIEELKKIKELKEKEPIIKEIIKSVRPFNSKYELREWLLNCDISQREYIKINFDCENFALDTCRAANIDGFELFPIFDVSGYFSPLKKHVLVGAVINNILYVSEPQDKNAQIIHEERLD